MHSGTITFFFYFCKYKPDREYRYQMRIHPCADESRERKESFQSQPEIVETGPKRRAALTNFIRFQGNMYHYPEMDLTK